MADPPHRRRLVVTETTGRDAAHSDRGDQVSRSPFPRGILVSALTVVALMLAGTATASASEQFYLHNSQTVTDVDHCYI
jgi:hypothetical protein